MSPKYLFVCVLLYSTVTDANQSMYCPYTGSYIQLGMSADAVKSACGAPSSIQQSNRPATRRVPVTQLIFNNAGTSTAFYGVWNIKTGYGGARVEVDVVDNKVFSLRVNGGNSNAVSVCNGISFSRGDPVAKVYNACGSPSLVNQTYIEQIIPNVPSPEIWTYNPSNYQASFSLTFVGGKLQSINQ